MTYQQALKLKQNGYPQTAKEVSRFSAVKDDGSPGEEVFYPTLKELIESCGEQFYSLHYGQLTRNDKKVWTAKSTNKRVVDGKDCKEAIVNLWLALNES